MAGNKQKRPRKPGPRTKPQGERRAPRGVDHVQPKPIASPVIDDRIDIYDAAAALAESRADRRRRQRAASETEPMVPTPPTRLEQFRQTARTPAFRWAAAWLGLGFLVILLSQVLPHEYGFLELGWLFTISIYDLVLAMLGLSVALAMVASARRAGVAVAVFVAVILVMELFFDPIFAVIRDSPLGYQLFLVAPAAVISTGLMLWLPERARALALVPVAALIGFSLSLFVGLDDLGVGIADFASGALFSAIWIVTAPALMLRQFRGPWLTVPARILGSWLIVIGIIVTVSLYLPMKTEAPPPPQIGDDPGLGETGDPAGASSLVMPDGSVIEIPDPAEEEQ